MPIDPRRYAMTVDGRNAERLADLERRAGRTDANSVNLVVRNRQYAEALGEVSTALAAPTNLGGPSVTVTVPLNSFVAVYVDVELKTSGVGFAFVHLEEPTDRPTAPGSYAQSSSTFYSRIGGEGRLFAPTPTPGVRTYSLRYSNDSGGTSFFRNRRLWVEVF